MQYAVIFERTENLVSIENGIQFTKFNNIEFYKLLELEVSVVI